MRIIKNLAVFYVMLAFVTACSSPEEKRKQSAEKLIYQDLQANLPDIKSYEVISTEVDTIRENWLLDFEIEGKINYLMSQIQSVEEAEEQLQEVERVVRQNIEEIDNVLLYHYGSLNFFEKIDLGERKQKLKKAREEARKYLEFQESLLRSGFESFYSALDEVNDTSFIGWEVKHKYRANNESGVPQIFESVYFINPGLDSIMRSYPPAEMYKLEQLRGFMNDAMMDTLPQD